MHDNVVDEEVNIKDFKVMFGSMDGRHWRFFLNGREVKVKEVTINAKQGEDIAVTLNLEGKGYEYTDYVDSVVRG